MSVSNLTGVESRLVSNQEWCRIKTGVESRLVSNQDVSNQDWGQIKTAVESRLVSNQDLCLVFSIDIVTMCAGLRSAPSSKMVILLYG
jgi:hypothetical protein